MFYYKLSCNILFSSLSLNSTAQCSGGSRISQTAVPTPDGEGKTYYLDKILPKNCIKMKEIGSTEGARIPSFPLCISQYSEGFSLSVALVGHAKISFSNHLILRCPFNFCDFSAGHPPYSLVPERWVHSRWCVLPDTCWSHRCSRWHTRRREERLPELQQHHPAGGGRLLHPLKLHLPQP